MLATYDGFVLLLAAAADWQRNAWRFLPAEAAATLEGEFIMVSRVALLNRQVKSASAMSALLYQSICCAAGVCLPCVVLMMCIHMHGQFPFESSESEEFGHGKLAQ